MDFLVRYWETRDVIVTFIFFSHEIISFVIRHDINETKNELFDRY